MFKSTLLASIGVFAPCILASPLVSLETKLSSRQTHLGLINFDGIATYCNDTEQTIIRRAFSDLNLLTDAVQGIFGGDQYFEKFFGTGWSGGKFGNYFFYVAGNLDKAKQATLDDDSAGKVFVTCQDTSSKCNNDNDETKGKPSAYTSIPRNEGDTQSMVFCPRAFAHFHLTDRSKTSGSTNLNNLVSYEHIALHELMHFDYAGYQTAVSAHADPETQSWNDDHIGDLKARISNLDKTKYTIYGPHLTNSYAQFKSPPLSATANADSYAWLATTKYFTAQGQSVYIRDDPTEDTTDEDEADPAQIFTSEDDNCEDAGQPAITDCQHIQVPTDYNNVKLGSACYTSGNRKWCDVDTFGSCQLSIGWDTTENGGKEPFLTDYQFSQYQINNFGTGQCSLHTETAPGACVQPQGTLCVTGYTFCMKRVGYSCP